MDACTFLPWPYITLAINWPISCQINTDAQPLCTYVMMLDKDVDAHLARLSQSQESGNFIAHGCWCVSVSSCAKPEMSLLSVPELVYVWTLRISQQLYQFWTRQIEVIIMSCSCSVIVDQLTCLTLMLVNAYIQFARLHMFEQSAFDEITFKTACTI